MILTITFPEMGEASCAQNTHKFHLHVIRVCIARVCKFLIHARNKEKPHFIFLLTFLRQELLQETE